VNERAARLLAEAGGAVLVTGAASVWWLTGLDGTNAAALVDGDGVRVFTDFRYATEARELGLTVVEVPRNVFSGLAEHLPERVAFEPDNISYAAWAAVSHASASELVPAPELLERLRAVKEPEELEVVRRAAAVTNEAFARLAEEPFVGRTEAELAWRLESTLRELGAEGTAFDVAVASGPSGALAHASPGGRVVERGELVVVDAGARVDGYCSDCTRTFATGPLDTELARMYETCLGAQLEALAAVLPGAAGRDVDAVARDRIDGEGYAGLFGHGLGHGVGVQIHELPRLRPESGDVLAVGNVVTVEPGIYRPGVGGVRIEDLVVVREDGAEILTTFPKELVTVG
jgi:Xaa-Pro aminopeptidase